MAVEINTHMLTFSLQMTHFLLGEFTGRRTECRKQLLRVPKQNGTIPSPASRQLCAHVHSLLRKPAATRHVNLPPAAEAKGGEERGLKETWAKDHRATFTSKDSKMLPRK